MTGIPYTPGMGKLTSLRNSETDARQSARAKHIHGLLAEERWSINQASMKLGMTKSVLASRMRGETPFIADELEEIAGLLKRDPVEFYREYLEVGLTGLGPVTSTVKERRFAQVIQFPGLLPAS